MAVSLVALFLMMWGFDPGSEPPAAPRAVAVQTIRAPRPDETPGEALTGAQDVLSALADQLVALLPRIGIAVALVVLALLVTRLFRAGSRRLLHGWERATALSALVGVAVLLLAVAAGLSVVAGDARALVGSVGLIGLALSWALQTPIESFTGWVLNALRGYYRVGDRIAVGDVFGDVYRIDILTTTVWEAGGEGKSVAGAQPTGALITFPNWEVLRSNVINYTRDFPFVWDEITIAITNESDLAYAIEVAERVADRALGGSMREWATRYRELAEQARIGLHVELSPRAFLSLADAWTNVTLRYLAPARQRRRIATDLIVALTQELARPEHGDRVAAAYPRAEVRIRDERATNHSFVGVR